MIGSFVFGGGMMTDSSMLESSVVGKLLSPASIIVNKSESVSESLLLLSSSASSHSCLMASLKI